MESHRSSPARIAVIGDVGGHRAELAAELDRLGADPATGRLPADLIVVQVGDLVHRGPDSDGVVALVDRYLTEQPAQWVQLAGNHEAQYLREPDFEWPERIGDQAIGRLRAWWSTGQLRIAVAVRAGEEFAEPGGTSRTGEEFLITHAGLTEGFWRQALDSPTSAADAARALNSFIGAHESVLFYAGQMLGGGTPNLTAGPVWAAAATELIPSWASGRRLPFSQVHGHSRVLDRRRDALRGTAALANVMTFDAVTAHETATLPGGRIIGVDPGHGRGPRQPWAALVLAGELLD